MYICGYMYVYLCMYAYRFVYMYICMCVFGVETFPLLEEFSMSGLVVEACVLVMGMHSMAFLHPKFGPLLVPGSLVSTLFQFFVLVPYAYMCLCVHLPLCVCMLLRVLIYIDACVCYRYIVTIGILSGDIGT